MSPGWSDTTTNYLQEVQDHGNLMREWWMTVFLSAINSLPEDSKTRLFNATSTALTTGILPTYVKIYPADVHSLNRAMHHMESSLNDHFSWYFICSKFGQRHEGMNHDGVLCPDAFGLSEMSNLSHVDKVCVHVATNFACKDDRFSLFQDHLNTQSWSSSTSEHCAYTYIYIYIYGISIQGKWGVATRRYVV